MSDIKVHCTDKGKDVDGFILNLRHKMFMDVAINTVKVKFQYDPQFKQYVGNMAGLEWIVKEEDLPDQYDEYKR
tara:strand:+ start:679 stop:900 length:222 start_codon:yes stop_codon:yes gene_type:complete